MAGIKIVDLPPLGRDLASTDLLELSLAGGTGSRKITGQEIMNTSKLNIGTTAITSGTVGRVLFEGTGNVVQESAGLTWDDTIGLLTIKQKNQTDGLRIENQANSALFFESYVLNAGFARHEASGSHVFRANGRDSLEIRDTYVEIKPSAFTRFFANNTEVVRIATTTGNLLLNTTTDAGYRLDVNGITKTQGLALGTVGHQLVSSNEICGRSALAISVKNSGGVLENQLYMTGTTTSAPTALFGIGFSGTPIARLQVRGSGTTSATTSFLVQNSSSTALMQLNDNGNLLINTTTDNGYKLDVNGTARFKDTGSASSIIMQYGTGGWLTVNNASATEAIRLRGGGGASYFNTGQNVLIGTTTDAGYKLDVNGTARVTSSLYVSNAGVGTTTAFIGGKVVIGSELTDAGYAVKIRSGNNGVAGIYLRGGGAGGYPIMFCQDYNGTASTTFIVRENGSVHVGATDNVPSSKLTLTSTTQGFLPPRMTQTQRNAIASPAIGLEIYQTDATEGKYIYKSSGWTYIG